MVCSRRAKSGSAGGAESNIPQQRRAVYVHGIKLAVQPWMRVGFSTSETPQYPQMPPTACTAFGAVMVKFAVQFAR